MCSTGRKTTLEGNSMYILTFLSKYNYFLTLTIQITYVNHFNILVINKNHNSSDQYIFNPQNTNLSWEPHWWFKGKMFAVVFRSSKTFVSYTVLNYPRIYITMMLVYNCTTDTCFNFVL
jgi:hypothetical protein